MKSLNSTGRYASRLGTSPWLLLIVGLVLALVVAAVAMAWLMRPPPGQITGLVSTLGATSVLSLALGYVLYRRGWARSPSLSLTLVVTYAWAALLALLNVWVMARRMFISAHDLTLAWVLLLFAAIIATTYGVFIAASVTDGLRHLARAARRLAAGDLSARARVIGRDEVSQVAAAFNEMANRLETASAERQEVEALRRDLIAWTSHDLRTPLTSIRVMIEALHDGVVTADDMRQRYYDTIRADVLALNHLIDDLFELAQLDANALILKREPHSLSDLISDTLETFRPIAAQRGIALEGVVGPNLDPVTMNASKIGRVLANLIGNSLQHAPESGRVRVEARRTREGVQVTVEDNGPGFSAEDLPRVFEKFYRGEQARSRTTGGAGLGLAIARGIVEAHDGRIWAANADGRGAIVGFVLPGL